MKRSLNGAPYSFTRTAAGFAVLPLTSLTDRFHRSYTVYVSAENKPLRCSCAHCVKAGAICKHMREVEAIIKEQS